MFLILAMEEAEMGRLQSKANSGLSKTLKTLSKKITKKQKKSWKHGLGGRKYACFGDIS
jgi:hypothetical protein